MRVTDSCLRNHTRQVEERSQIEDDLQARCCNAMHPCCRGRVWMQRTHGFSSAGAHFQPPGLASSWTGSDVMFDEYLSSARRKERRTARLQLHATVRRVATGGVRLCVAARVGARRHSAAPQAAVPVASGVPREYSCRNATEQGRGRRTAGWQCRAGVGRDGGRHIESFANAFGWGARTRRSGCRGQC